jgi:hypothetical protein
MPRRTGAFFAQRREWSVWKHQIFEGYAAQFSRILGRDRGLVYLVDGFAGRGVYGEGAKQAPAHADGWIERLDAPLRYPRAGRTPR